MPTLQELRESFARGAAQELNRNLPPEPPLPEEAPPGTEMVDVGEEPPPPQPGAAGLPPPEVEDRSGEAGATSEERRAFAESLIYGDEAHQPYFLSGENAGALGGGIAGAKFGARLGVPGAVAGGFIGSVVGAIGGAGADEGVKEVWQQATGTDEPPEEEEGWLGLLGQAGNRGAWNQALGEGLGFLVAPIRRTLQGPTAKHLNEQMWLAWEQGGEGLANRYRWIKRGLLEKIQPAVASVGRILNKMDQKREARLDLVRKRQQRLEENREFGFSSATTDLFQEKKGGFFARLGESSVGASITGSAAVDFFVKRRIREAEDAATKVHDDLYRIYTRSEGIPFSTVDESLDEAGALVYKRGQRNEVKWRAAADRIFNQARLAFGEDAGSAAPNLFRRAKEVIAEAMTHRSNGRGGTMNINNVSDRASFRADPRAGVDDREVAAAAEWLNRTGLFQESPTPLQLEQLWAHYKELGKRAGAAKSAGGGGDSSVWTRLFIAASQDMDQLAANIPGRGNQLFRAANKFYQMQVADRYIENKTWQAMGKAQQSKIGEMLLNHHTTIEDVEGMKKAFGRKGFEQLRAAWMYSLVNRVARDPTKPTVAVVSEGEDLFSIKNLLRETSEKRMKPAVLAELFGAEYPRVRQLRKKLQDLVETRLFKQGENLARQMDAQMANQRMGILIMGMLKGIAQAGGGAGAGVATVGFLGGDALTAGAVGAGTALLAPLALGKLLFSEGGLKWLIEGVEIEQALNKIPLVKGLPLAVKRKMLERKTALWVGKLGHILATSKAPWEGGEEEGQGSRGEVPLAIPSGP